ncbi:sensor histidine kinase [Caloranaerobacter ferrireducens]|uniref:sensor histidine kinase n=1 Tax=Caloranaerobacter ferrireducens TaxID=1323370 RepID=UPI00084DA7C7|nr:sensor histidine kinase [Caloranaerobacter ferrireducens]
MSLKKRITLTICLINILLLILLSWVIYSKSAFILNKEAEVYMLSQLDRVKENIDLRIRINKLETENLALNEKIISFLKGKIDVNEMNNILIENMSKKNQKSNYYKDLFVLNNQGKIIATCMPEAMNLDLSDRKYFIESKKTRNTVTSDILIARSDGSLIVITISPIRDSTGIVLGYAGIAIKAEFFSKIANELRLGKRGYYAIVDSSNRILTHPNSKLIAKNSIYNITDEILKKSKVKTNTVVEKRIVANNGVKEFQIYKLMDSNRWILIAVLPEHEMYEKSITLLSYVLLIGTISIILAILLGTYVSNKISKPIITITNHLEMATKSNLLIKKSISDSIKSFKKNGEKFIRESEKIKISPNDEIGNLRKALKNLKEYFLFLINMFEIESENLVKYSKELSSTIENTSFRTARFISTLSHDLKTLITLIKGYAKGLKSGIIADEKIKNEFLDGIIKGAEDIEKITCDILDNAYEAQCMPKLNREKVNAKYYIEELFESTKQYIISSNRVFEGAWSCNDGYLYIDIIKIKRAWNNLINNAVKYSNEKSRIKIFIMQKENKVEFRVIDEGIGISDKEIDKIFDMFYRGEKNKEKGYGLGLFITKSIIEAHNSKLHVKSEYGKGTEFWFSLDIYSSSS